jgi:hypothetical protein
MPLESVFDYKRCHGLAAPGSTCVDTYRGACKRAIVDRTFASEVWVPLLVGESLKESDDGCLVLRAQPKVS